MFEKAVKDLSKVCVGRAAAHGETDTMQAVRQFIAEFQRLKPNPGAASGDEGGVGTVMCNALRDAGWYINRVDNGAAANRSDVYANRGAEIWFEGKRLIEERKIILPDDPGFI